MIDRYYEEELRYLYESGREFAKTHPQIAQFLNIDALGDRDPYVERLFEGFAFLSARIRQKLDDGFPELTENLIGLLWPELLQQIPSVCMVQMNPRPGFLQETRILPRGAELLSDPIGSESVTGTFVTTTAVRLNPISLQSIARSIDTKRRTSFSLTFEIDPSVDLKKLSLEPLRLYLYAEMPVALTLHEFMTRAVVEATIRFEDGAGEAGDQSAISGGGLAESEALLPNPVTSFWAYSLLREYFVCTDKFLFVDLHGLTPSLLAKTASHQFTYTLVFDREFPADRPFDSSTFRLHCTPAVNLFRRTIEPIKSTAFESEYRLVADLNYPSSFDVHSVISLQGVDRIDGKRNDYSPLYAFKNEGRTGERTFTAQYRNGVDGKRNIVVSLGGAQLSGEEIREENIVVDALCTNGVLPRDTISEGGLSRPGAGFPDFITFTNITRPSLPCTPPEPDRYLWTFLSMLSATFSSLAQAPTLRSFLRLFDWSDSEGQKRKIDAITEVTMHPAKNILAGTIISGVEVRLSILEANFLHSGDIALFGSVLHRFFAAYASINSFVDMRLILKPTGKEIVFLSREGTRWTV